MGYKRTTRDEYRLFVNYGQGWEYEVNEPTWKEMKAQIRCYRENCPQYSVKYTGPHRVKINQLECA